MIGGFNVRIEDIEKLYPYKKIGEYLFKNDIKVIDTKLESYLGPDGSLDADSIKEDWFPELKYDIFLSHSHSDFDLVVSFAGWLYEKTGLKSFIDSCIWKYADDLIKKLDDAYSLIPNKKNVYSYENVLKTTSHVHMLLNTALINMIDKSTCLMFINTPNSICVKDEINGDKTLSPWIYSEIFTANIIQKNRRNFFMESAEFSHVPISYKVPLEGFHNLTFEDIERFLYDYVGDLGRDFIIKLLTSKSIG